MMTALAAALALGLAPDPADGSFHTALRLAQSWSCGPRKTCSKTVESCEEAYWLLENCSWGGKLDRDGDGVPCETLCPGG